MTDPIYIASFDIGKKNFAFCIEEMCPQTLQSIPSISKPMRYMKDGSCSAELSSVLHRVCMEGRIILIENIDLTGHCSSKGFDTRILINLTNVLTKYESYWNRCFAFIIEQQMSFGKKRNYMAFKIAQHCFSYFLIQYASFKHILEYPSYHKTRVFGAPKSFSKYQRKKWAIEKATEILNQRGDTDTLRLFSSSKKKDDLSDIIVQLQSFKYLYFVEKSII